MLVLACQSKITCSCFIRILRSSSLLVMLDLMFGDHMTGYVTIFWQENMKNCNLLSAKWKIFITYRVFEIEKSIRDVKFVVQRPRDRIRRHFLVGNMTFLKLTTYPATLSPDIIFDITNGLPQKICQRYIFKLFQLAKYKIIIFHFFPPKMAVYPVTWSSDIKSNITNRLPNPENPPSDVFM